MTGDFEIKISLVVSIQGIIGINLIYLERNFTKINKDGLFIEVQNYEGFVILTKIIVTNFLRITLDNKHIQVNNHAT